MNYIGELLKAMQGRGAVYIILLSVLYGGYMLSSKALDGFVDIGNSLNQMNKNVELLKVEVIRLGDTMGVVKDQLKDQEARIRDLERAANKRGK
jgi:hypothetical protein